MQPIAFFVSDRQWPPWRVRESYRRERFIKIAARRDWTMLASHSLNVTKPSAGLWLHLGALQLLSEGLKYEGTRSESLTCSRTSLSLAGHVHYTRRVQIHCSCCSFHCWFCTLAIWLYKALYLNETTLECSRSSRCYLHQYCLWMKSVAQWCLVAIFAN